MKKLAFLLAGSLVYALGAAACGSSTSGDDAGGGDATTDATTDATGSDATSNDAGSDSSPADAAADSSAGDAGLGATCDLNNDQCGPGLKCCGGGAQLDDAGTGHCITTPDSGKCPLIP